MRMSAAATAKAPSMEPMTDALIPLSKPSTGTTKVCTSQQDDKNQFTNINRRNVGSRNRSQDLGGVPPFAATTGGSSRVRRTKNQLAMGNTAMKKKAAR